MVDIKLFSSPKKHRKTISLPRDIFTYICWLTFLYGFGVFKSIFQVTLSLTWDQTYFQADLAKIPKLYMPKVLWRDGKFVPNPHLQSEDGEKNVTSSHNVMKECNTLMTVRLFYFDSHHFFSTLVSENLKTQKSRNLVLEL